MSRRPFLTRVEQAARTLQAQNAQLGFEALDNAYRLAAEDSELIDELDKIKVYFTMATNWTETSYRPTDLRREKERKGSIKGVANRIAGNNFTKQEMFDELRSIYDPSKDARWHLNKLTQIYPEIKVTIRTVQRYLKEIRKK